jgi:hypothetical protein
MLSLMDEAVKSKILKKVDGEYEFDSGKGMSDFIDFIFYQMFNWQYYNGATTATVDVEEGCAAEDGGTTEEGDDEEVDAATDGEDGHTAANSNEGNAGETATDDGLVLASPPHDYFPLGFMSFLTCGPMAEPNHCISSLDLDSMLDFMFWQGRKSHVGSSLHKKSLLQEIMKMELLQIPVNKEEFPLVDGSLKSLPLHKARQESPMKSSRVNYFQERAYQV